MLQYKHGCALIYLWRRTEVVITGQTRNLLVGSAGPRVRIPPSPLRKVTHSEWLFSYFTFLFAGAEETPGKEL